MCCERIEILRMPNMIFLLYVFTSLQPTSDPSHSPSRSPLIATDAPTGSPTKEVSLIACLFYTFTNFSCVFIILLRHLLFTLSFPPSLSLFIYIILHTPQPTSIPSQSPSKSPSSNPTQVSSICRVADSYFLTMLYIECFITIL